MPKRSTAARVQDDALGKYVEIMASKFLKSRWQGVLKQAHNRSDMWPIIPGTYHPAIQWLEHLGKKGAPVLMKMPPFSIAIAKLEVNSYSYNA
jgi:hypothetical protein